MQDLTLLKMTSKLEENGEITIQVISPLSTVELTTDEEIALQIYKQLGKRFLETIESEMEQLQFDVSENTQDTYHTLGHT